VTGATEPVPGDPAPRWAARHERPARRAALPSIEVAVRPEPPPGWDERSPRADALDERGPKFEATLVQAGANRLWIPAETGCGSRLKPAQVGHAREIYKVSLVATCCRRLTDRKGGRVTSHQERCQANTFLRRARKQCWRCLT
jgi:hypothetical protein